MRAIILSLAGLLLAPTLALAQPEPEKCAYFAARIDALANGTAPKPGQDFALDLLDIGQDPRCFAQDAAARAVPKPVFDLDFLSRFEGSRGDKQSGATGTGAGSTSVVSQGPVAKVLSVAAEYGAITQSVKGQVITIRGNAAGLPTALVRKGAVPYCVPEDRSSRPCIGGPALAWLRKFSFATSFNATQQTEAVGRTDSTAATTAAGQPVVFEAAGNQLASFSGRLELVNHRDIASTDFHKKWVAELGKDVTVDELLAGTSALANPALLSADYQAWQKKHAANVRAAGTNRALIVAALNAALADLQPILRKQIPGLDKKLTAALAAYNNYFVRQGEMLDEIATKDVLAVEYTNSRPASQPHTSNLRVIWDAPFKKKHKLVANVGVTWFNTSQTNTNGKATNYRDAQAAVQYEHGLGDIILIGPATISAAFYYQFQHAPAILKVDPLKPVPGVTFVDLPEGAKTVFAEKGDILLGQLRLSLTPKDSSVKVPLAVTFSNRTELINKPAWKAQIGVAYDFDSLFARGK